MPSVRENNDFQESVISSNILDEAVDWVSTNLSPEEVYDNDSLETWAEENGYIKEDSIL